MEDRRLRCYLTGRVGLEGAGMVDQRDLPGRQGRLALVRLVCARHAPLPTDVLAAAIWGQTLPASWDTSLRAIVSRLRRALGAASSSAQLLSDGGCYQAVLGDAWVDVEVADNAVDRAEGALRRGDAAAAWSDATVAAGIAARPVLPGEDLPWVGELQGRVRATRVRALDVLAQVYSHLGDGPLAIAVARQLTELEPYRESGYRHLMQAYLDAGDRGEAVRVFAGLRARLAEELGVEPDPETVALHLRALRDRTG